MNKKVFRDTSSVLLVGQGLYPAHQLEVYDTEILPDRLAVLRHDMPGDSDAVLQEIKPKDSVPHLPVLTSALVETFTSLLDQVVHSRMHAVGNLERLDLPGVLKYLPGIELPFLGRSLYDFVDFMPGATLSNGAIGIGFAINGGRTQSATHLLDGTESNKIMMSAPAMDVPLDTRADVRHVSALITVAHLTRGGCVQEILEQAE